MFLGNTNYFVKSTRGVGVTIGSSTIPNGLVLLNSNGVIAYGVIGIGMIPNALGFGPNEKVQVNGFARFLPNGQTSSALGLQVGHDGANGIIDNVGNSTSSLLINYYSGNNVSIGTGATPSRLTVGKGITSRFNSTIDYDYNFKAEVNRNYTKAIAVVNTVGNVENFLVYGDGTVFARELKIRATSFIHPDYVFDEDYQLMPLLELEKYFKTNKHLPNIPSTKDVKENDGVNVGEMQNKLLEKVEELTLYLVQIHKENEKLKMEIENLKKMNIR
ncbi:MAG: hypothetical protein IPO63_13120 [Bacteroidetes bacterium]|nr:hypothetical protein [Bacteroidota bacterium]